MDKLNNEWVKCYSKSRKRDYYFNKSTGQSIWDLNELKDVKLKSDDDLTSSIKPDSTTKESVSKKSRVKMKAKEKMLKTKALSMSDDTMKRKIEMSPDVNILR